jgi:hypothetical protein
VQLVFLQHNEARVGVSNPERTQAELNMIQQRLKEVIEIDNTQ